MIHPHNFVSFSHLPIKLFFRQKVTFKFWRIVLVFVFKLHIFNYNFRKINACYFLVPFFVHVFSKGRVTYFYNMDVPAPTLRIVLYFLINCETISRRFSQFWYQSNSVEFLWLIHKNTKHIFFPRKFVCRNDYFFRNTLNFINMKGFKF